MKLCPTQQKDVHKKIYGFDIETYDDNKQFLMASIVGENFKEVFYNKQDTIDFFKKKRFQNSYVAATNLQFDFFGLFYGSKEAKQFKTLFKGSDLMFAASYIKNKQFSRWQKNAKSLTFIDTFNYIRIGVDALGKIIGIDKLKDSVSHMIGKKPDNEADWKLMTKYNLRDSKISREIICFFFRTFSSLGATPKKTIASTAMSLYKNKYLNKTYYVHPNFILRKIFSGYHGANTHAYARGLIEDLYYYDFNSLYPSVMRNHYPDPNTYRHNYMNTNFYIENFEGMSDVTVDCPYMDYPLLPVRADKTLTPIGKFRGWFTHVELNKAVELGYSILKVHECIYYKENCYPFKSYVEELYELRMQYKKQDNSMQLVVKLFLNSLYGKFGQKFFDRDNWEYFNHSIEELNKLDFFERVGDFIRIKVIEGRPACFCFPIWAAYTTAYGRLKLHEYILKSNPVYVDTDSLITKKKFHDSDELGKLKLEMKIKRGIIVKPKFYMIKDNKTTFIKVKGLGTTLNEGAFYRFLNDPKVMYKKFVKLKEAVRRKFTPNEIIDFQKCFDLEDNKRIWGKKFNFNELQYSTPINMDIVNQDFLKNKNEHKEVQYAEAII